MSSIITVLWQQKPRWEDWGKVVLAYDNNCRLTGLEIRRQGLITANRYGSARPPCLFLTHRANEQSATSIPEQAEGRGRDCSSGLQQRKRHALNCRHAHTRTHRLKFLQLSVSPQELTCDVVLELSTSAWRERQKKNPNKQTNKKKKLYSMQF